MESLSYLRSSALPGVEILVASPSASTWRMLHERYLLCGCQSVSSSWIYRRKTRYVNDGATAFMEPGEIHTVVAKRKPSFFWALFIEPANFLKMAGEFGIKGVPHFAVTEVYSKSLLRKLQALSAGLKNRENHLKLQSQMAELMHEALPYAEGRPNPGVPDGQGLARSLRTAREMLEERYHENIALEDLAKEAALSRFHLVRSFRLRYGFAPHAYQIQLRVKHACRMLRSGATCAEAASAVGFADQSHLARHFRRVMGVSPRKYLQGQ